MFEPTRRTLLTYVAVIVVGAVLTNVFDGEDGALGVVSVLGTTAATLAIMGIVAVGLVALNNTDFGCIGAFLTFGAVLMLAGGIIAITQIETADETEDAALKALAPRAAAYAKSSAKRSAKAPRLRGRVVVVDVAKRKIHKGIYIRLPRSIQAQKPGEVTTIVQVRYGKDVVGTYKPGGGKAIQEYAALTVIDRLSHRSFAVEQIAGPDPPYGKSGFDRGDETGGRPSDHEIAAVLNDLPRIPVE